MIEAGHLDVVVVPVEPVRQPDGVEQRHVRGIGQQTGMQDRVIGQDSVDAQPHLLRTGDAPGPLHRSHVDIAQVDRTGLIDPVPELGSMGLHPLMERPQRLRIGNSLGKRHLVVETGLGHLETRLQVEDRLSVLDRHDAPGRETLPVTNSIDLKEDRNRRVTRAQEVGVQRMHTSLRRVDGARRGHERLTGDLPAEHPLTILGR